MLNVACPARTKAGMCTTADCTKVKPNFCKTPCWWQFYPIEYCPSLLLYCSGVVVVENATGILNFILF